MLTSFGYFTPSIPPSPSHLKMNPPKEPTSIRVKQPTPTKLKLKGCWSLLYTDVNNLFL